MRILPEKRIHGFTFAELFSKAMVWSGYKVQTRSRGWDFTEEYYQLENDELEAILQDFLKKFDS